MPEEKDLDNRSKSYRMRRSIMDYGMGLIIFSIGLFLLFAPHFGVVLDIGDGFRFAFGTLCLVYGFFRIYRGYRKKYFN